MKLFFIFLLTTLYNTHTMEHLIETNLNNPFLSLSIFSDEQVPQEIRENLSHQLQEYWNILAQELSRPESPWLTIPHQEDSFQDLIEEYLFSHDQNRSKAADRMRFIAHIIVPIRNISSEEGTAVLQSAICKAQEIFTIAEQLQETDPHDSIRKALKRFNRIIGPFCWPYEALH
jgi:hypothetical protein